MVSELYHQAEEEIKIYTIQMKSNTLGMSKKKMTEIAFYTIQYIKSDTLGMQKTNDRKYCFFWRWFKMPIFIHCINTCHLTPRIMQHQNVQASWEGSALPY